MSNALKIPRPAQLNTPFRQPVRCELCGGPIRGIPNISLYPPAAGALLLCRKCTNRFDTGTGGFLVTPDIGIIDWEGDYAYEGEGISVAERAVSAKTEPEIQKRSVPFWE